jgi:hypothetical protein
VLAAAALLAAAACSSQDIVAVTDPDIITPENVGSAEGAEALRIGTLSRFNGATTGDNGNSAGETLFMYGGLLADEWQTGDSFIQRVETDQRVVTESNTLIRNGYQFAHRARVSAQEALAALRQYAPATPAYQLAEMYFVQAYIENLLAESFCSGLPFSTVLDGQEQLGSPLTSVQTYERALAHADSGLALITGATANDVKIRSALAVVKGRILLNLNRPTDAATAVAAVATSAAYTNAHSQTTRDVTMWAMNNSARRYTVGQSEGGNGLPFHTGADPRVPICNPRPTLSTTCRNAGVTSTVVFNNGSPTLLYVQLIWSTRDANVAIATGTEARLIEAEALLRAGDNAGALAKLNALRAGVTGLAPLADAGSAAARQDQLFRERAYWLFGTGHRLGDLRRLIRQYGRSQATLFPVGVFAEGGTYGTDVNLPIPQAERNNPNFNGCLDRNA